MDNTFDAGNYILTMYRSNPSIQVLGQGQCPGCGNPGQAFFLNLLVPGIGSERSAIINKTFAYDPSSQGAITSLSFTVDKLLTTSPEVPSTDAIAIRIQQGGKIYGTAVTAPNFFGTTGWRSYSGSGLVATNFLEFDYTTGVLGTGHPDFAGGPMLFGLGQLTETFSVIDPNFTVSVTWDNLDIELNTVPEPASMLLLATGLLGVARTIKKRMT